MAGTCEDALGALSAHLGLPLEFNDGSCSFNVGGQPFTITNDDELDRLVVSALVADDLPEAPSRKLMTDLLDLGFGMMHEGLPAVGRDPETGFDSFMKFVSFALRLSDRLDNERHAPPEAPPPSDDASPEDVHRIMV